jgi:hypothetical protein
MLTGPRESLTVPRMGRPKINDEQTPARFPEGTLDRIEAVLKDGEARSDFIRTAVESELKRRERKR